MVVGTWIARESKRNDRRMGALRPNAEVRTDAIDARLLAEQPPGFDMKTQMDERQLSAEGGLTTDVNDTHGNASDDRSRF